jgi:hypothetical protein
MLQNKISNVCVGIYLETALSLLERRRGIYDEM